MYLLVKYNDNYSDEFDISGFKLYTKEEWVKFALNARILFECKVVEYYFGSNEAISYEHGVDNFLTRFTLLDITEEMYTWLNTFVCYCGKYGFFPDYIVNDAGQS